LRFCIIIILCFTLFTGCASEEERLDRAMDLRTKISNAHEIQFQCTVTADYYDEVCTFVMDCIYDEEDQIHFQVIEPDTISGISGLIDGKKGHFTFDDQILAFKPMDGRYLSPIYAPWFLLNALQGGFIHSASAQKDGYCVTYRDNYQEETLTAEVQFAKANVPIKCEIYWAERRILLIEICNFVFL